MTPGNNLRPDLGRSFVSFLWSFLDMPQWARHRNRLRWFTCSYVQKSQMKNASISINNIAKAILLDLFRNTERNFETTGILLRHGSETLIVRMRFATSPQDWLAQVEMYGMKGQCGLNPCPLCDNCMGRRAFFEDDSSISHVLSPMYGLSLLTLNQVVIIYLRKHIATTIATNVQREDTSSSSARSVFFFLKKKTLLPSQQKQLSFCSIRRHLLFFSKNTYSSCSTTRNFLPFNKNTFRLVQLEEMYSSSTRTHFFLLNRKTILFSNKNTFPPAQQEDILPCRAKPYTY